MYEMMTEFSDSLDYCQSRNSRLLNEQDTKVIGPIYCNVRPYKVVYTAPAAPL